MNIDPIEEYFKDPDKRAKLFLLYAAAQIITTFLMVIGVIFLILYALKII